MRRKIITALIVCLGAIACVCGLAACDGDDEHSHNFTTTVVDPTCVQDGYTLYECECGWSYKGDEVPATGVHSFTDYKSDNNATCIADGTESLRCEVCQEIKDTRVVEGSATGVHSYDDYVCEWCDTVDPQAPETQGLSYTAIYENNKIIGYGVSKGSNENNRYIQIPSEYSGKPVVTISENAFSGCWQLVHVVIPNSVTSIEESAFRHCSRLTTVDIPNSVTSIGRLAFSYCLDLPMITIPESVTSIGKLVFGSCSSLETVYWNAASCTSNSLSAIFTGTALRTIIFGDSVTSIGDNLFSGCTGITGIQIPDSVTSIGNNAFYRCSGLMSVAIGNGVTSIGAQAFRDCSSLTSLTIGNGVTNIGNSAFYGCRNLTSFVLPNSVTSIEYSAFAGCSSLTSITIPISVTSMEGNIFGGCRGLTIYCEAENKPNGWSSNWASYSIPIIWYCKHNNKDIDGYEYAIINGVKYSLKNMIATVVGQPSNLNGAIAIPLSVTYKSNAYRVTGIAEYAFQGCSGITSIEISSTITNIGRGAFYGCSGITSIEIPSGVTNIGSGVFSGCNSLASIIVQSGNVKYYSDRNCIIETDSKTLVAGCKNSIIPAEGSVMKIGGSAFAGCSSLTSIEIPNSVTEIGSSAFASCSSLTSIEIPNSVTSIGYSAFASCSSLTSIEIPNSVTSIGGNVIEGCYSLTSIVFNGTREQWDTISKDYSWNINSGSYTITFEDGTTLSKAS